LAKILNITEVAAQVEPVGLWFDTTGYYKILYMEDNSKNNKIIAKNSIYMSIRMVFVLLLTFYTTRVVLQVLGVEDYGVYNVVGGFVSMFAFLNTSMTNGIQRFYNYELGKNGEQGAHRVYVHALLVQLMIVLVIIMITETIGLWYVNSKMVIPTDRLFAAQCVYHCSILGFIFLVFQAPFSAAVMAHEKMGYFSFIGVLDAVLKLLIVLALPYFSGDRLIWYGVLYASINLINLLLYYLYSKIKFPEIYLSSVWDSKMFTSMVTFSGWNIFGSFSNLIKEQGLNLVLNLFFGPIVNAARGVAQQINGGIHGFVANITVPVRPQIIQSYAKGNYDRVMNLTYTVSKLSSCFLYFIALPVMLEVDFILHIWLGDNIPEHTGVFVIIVIIQSVANNLNSAVSGIVHASGKMKRYQLTGCIINLSALPIAYGFLRLGASPEMALVVNMVVTFIMQYAALIVLKSIISYSLAEYGRKVIFPFLLVVFGGFTLPFICHLVMDEGWCRFFVVLLLSVLSVGVITYKTALTPAERALLMSFINRKQNEKSEIE